MRGSLQSEIRPGSQGGVKEFNTAKVAASAVQAPKANEADFLTVLNNSNSDTKRTREAKALNGGLDGTESYDEFLAKMDDKAAKQRVPKNNLDKDDFLKLFITQLQNQDPLSPEDSSEMASRLAQFNSLEQALNSNKTLTSILDGQKQSRSLDLINYVGKEVEIKGGRIRMDGTQPSEAAFKLERAAMETTLEIRDSSGAVVDSTNLGNMNPGDQKISWDGKRKDGTQAAAGVYNFSVIAKGMNGEDIPVSIVSRAKITGVDVQDKEGSMHSDLGKVKFDEVQSIGDSGYKSAQVETDQAAKLNAAAQAVAANNASAAIANASKLKDKPNNKDGGDNNGAKEQLEGLLAPAQAKQAPAAVGVSAQPQGATAQAVPMPQAAPMQAANTAKPIVTPQDIAMENQLAAGVTR